jgi:tetratricopeptide (TPR) repeat protein
MNTSQAEGWVSRISSLPLMYAYVSLIALILIVYTQTVSFRYTHFDDDSLIENNYPVLKDASKMKEVFKQDVFFGTHIAEFYRPLQVFSYMLDTQLGGARPSSYHVSNMILHCAVCCSLLYLLLFLRFPKLLSFLLAAIYAIHPVFVQTVCWLPSRGDILITLFSLWTFIFYLKYYKRGGYGDLLLQGLCFALAVFSKETAVVFPVLLIAYSFLSGSKKTEWRRMIIAGALWMCVLGVWFLLRKNVVQSLDDPNVYGIGPLLHNLPALAVFPAKFFLPFGLSPMPVFTFAGIVTGVILFAAFTFWAKKEKIILDRRFLVGGVWFFVLTMPGLWYRHEMGAFAYDYLTHRLYLPAVGLLIACAALLSPVFVRHPKTTVVIGICLCLAAGIDSGALAGRYADAVVFEDYAIATNPSAAIALNNRGNRRVREGKMEEGMKDLNDAIRFVPRFPIALSNRGIALRNLGRIDAAFADFNEAIRIDSTSPESNNNRGTLFLQVGKAAEAERDFSRALTRNPVYPNALNGRGLARQALGNFNAALDDFNQALRLQPRFALAYNNRGILKGTMKNHAEAAADFTECLRYNPSNVDALFNRSLSREQLGDRGGAVTDLSLLIQINPGSGKAYAQRGLMKFKSGDKDGAKADWIKASQLGDQYARDLFQKNFNGRY